jgi:hypothetical protein
MYQLTGIQFPVSHANERASRITAITALLRQSEHLSTITRVVKQTNVRMYAARPHVAKIQARSRVGDVSDQNCLGHR